MQRNPQNQVKMGGEFVRRGSGAAEGTHGKTPSTAAAGICSKCKTEIPPKPGFRLSALKCPKCGSPAGKK